MKTIISNRFYWVDPKLLFCLFCISFLINGTINSQSCPVCPNNLSFGSGNFSNWTGVCGGGYFGSPLVQTPGGYHFGTLPTPQANPHVVYEVGQTGTPAPRFAITSGAGFDPNIPTLPVVAPCGSGYSARVGGTGPAEYGVFGAPAAFEALTYTLNVTAANAGFTYMYAAVLENGPGHDAHTQAQFEVIMTRCSDGSLLPCGQYKIHAGNGSSQFNTGSGTFQYTNWTSVSTDLTNYIGQQVCITFRVRDCLGSITASGGMYNSGGGGGHRGYAYVDAYCSPVQYVYPEFCSGAGSVQICAPPGYAAYSWPSGQPGLSGAQSTRCVTINAPQDGITYTVNMTSNGGCPVTMQVPIKGIPVNKSQETVVLCPGTSTTLSVSATGTNTPYSYSWSHGLGGGTTVTVSPIVATTYTVVVTNGSGCTSNELFYVNPVSVSVPAASICPGGSTVLTASGATTYTWSPASGLSSTTGASVTANPAATTTYPVVETGTGF